MKMKKNEFIQRITSWFYYIGFALMILVITTFLITVIYEWLVPPTDMHILGLLTAILLLYVAPIASILLLFAAFGKIHLSFIKRNKENNDNS
ncbi:hypothetical protein PQO03_11530 [Lentisphaera profundi]|uniref:Uncharacterized protein n=1 Tax=Lentisphaera profundi TaxID=1658616 RepID=A0ABY7VSZ3_9BACT|nr:hypothetical protein [Lentisphaera profundi]WDE96340.1 hypothetical protein PQO03_11530 [Lentisphaera profundi]